MFHKAFSFNQDLCAWGSKLQKLQNGNGYFNAMFYLAPSCPESADHTPSLTGTFPGPLSHSCVFFTFTDSNIRQAVEEWIDNPDDALAIYGDIATWDTRHVTNMDRLFYNRATFNDDISRWNVESVSSMKGMFHVERPPSINPSIGGTSRTSGTCPTYSKKRPR